MDTVDSIGAYWSFYSIWNSLNVLPMTQSDAPNEGREENDLEKSHKGFWQHQILQLIDARTEGHDGLRLLLDDVDKILAFHKQLFVIKKVDGNEIKELRDQLSKEREMRKELVHGITKSDSELLEIGKGFAEYPYKESVIENVDDFTSGFYAGWKTLSGNIEVILAKASELDKNQKQ